MSFRDQWATDANGKRFVFTVEMQRRLSEAGLPVEPEYLSELEPQSAPPDTYTPQPKREHTHHQHQSPPQREKPPEEDFEAPDTVQIDPMSGKYLGRVKWYNGARGYGFIARGAGEEIFFHKSDMSCRPSDLEPGTWILYDVEETDKGLEASEVELYTEQE